MSELNSQAVQVGNAVDRSMQRLVLAQRGIALVTAAVQQQQQEMKVREQRLDEKEAHLRAMEKAQATEEVCIVLPHDALQLRHIVSLVYGTLSCALSSIAYDSLYADTMAISHHVTAAQTRRSEQAASAMVTPSKHTAAALTASPLTSLSGATPVHIRDNARLQGEIRKEVLM